MRQPLVVANWKMNGSGALVDTMSAGLRSIDWSELRVAVVVAPPSPFIEKFCHRLDESSIEIGVQDISVHDEGAYTGEISAKIAAEVGAKYAIVGHSERRTYHGETDTLVASKVGAALSTGLTPICCVGETLEERESGQAETVVAQQVKAVTDVFAGSDELKKIVFAYEPIWAIGTGKTASASESQAMHNFIRHQLGAASAEIRILYGGSVKPENATELFCQPDIDGGLIGGASLVPQDFIEICQAAKAAEN